MSKPYTLLILLLVLVIHNIFFIDVAFAAASEECDIFQITFDCDLSGWMKLILGDLAIAASLALFLHYLAHRSNIKTEQNTQAIKNNQMLINKILTEQQKTKEKRQTYVIQSFKNQFNVLLLCIGLIKKLQDDVVNNKNVKQNDLDEKTTQRHKEIEDILYKLYNTLNLSIDVIDPLLIDQIEQFLVIVEQNLLVDIKNKKSINYDTLKSNIIQLTKRLNDYSDSDSVLK